MSLTPVQHWGLHESGGFWFLHEQDRAVCLTPGLEKLESPFKVEQRARCPHAFLPLALQAKPCPATAGLSHALAPIPDGRAFWTPESAATEIMRAPFERLTAPIVFTPWATPIKRLVPQLNLTNILPLVIVNYEPQHVIEISKLLSIPRVRTIILCGPVKPAGVVEVEPTIEWFSPMGALASYIEGQT